MNLFANDLSGHTEVFYAVYRHLLREIFQGMKYLHNIMARTGGGGESPGEREHNVVISARNQRIKSPINGADNYS